MLKNSKASKFLIGAFVALALVISANVSAADFGSATLKVGSKGEYVKTLQTLVGASPVDGIFGNGTKAKVMAWQANNGLTADGLFGAMSKAKANAGSVVGGLPAGCTSTSGYSTTTGASCATSTSTVPGCTAGAMFSSTTGASCSTGTTVVTGGAGSATITELSTPSTSTKVSEGAVGTKVYGVEIEADNGSDLSVTSMKLTFINGGSGSKKFDRYAKSVSVWYNDAKVGSANVSEFSEDSNTYTKSITIANSIVKAGAKGKFYVAVDAISDIDSGNVTSTYNTWTVTLASTRYQDGAGAILTDSTGSLANTFIFDSLSNSNDVELKVNLSSSNMTAKTIKASTTSDTNQVELLRFTLKAQGSAMSVDQIPVNFTTSESDLDDVTSNVTLKIGGNTYNETVSTSTSAVATVLFNELNLSIAADATVEGVIYADINDIETTSFDEGTTLSAAMTSTLVTATSGNYIDVEDVNGDQLVTGDRTGSAQGETMTFRSTGVNTVMGAATSSNTTDTNGLVTSVTYTIPVAVTSFGNTLYIGQSAQLATAASASNAFALVAETAAAPTTESVSATTSITLATTNATIESNGYRLDDGVTKNFVITVVMTAATDNTQMRFRLDTIRTFTEAGLVTATNSDLLPTTNFRTGFAYINN